MEQKIKLYFQNTLKDPTALMLLAANVITLGMALAFDWGVLTIMWTYWIQSAIVGFFIATRLIGTVEEYFKTTILFYFFYYVSLAVYVFVIWLVPLGMLFLCGEKYLRFTFNENSNLFVDGYAIILAGLSFLTAHVFSFIYYLRIPIKMNFPEEVKANLPRVLPMSIVITLGCLLLLSGVPTNVIIVLIFLLKIPTDILMHNIKHAKQREMLMRARAR